MRLPLIALAALLAAPAGAADTASRLTVRFENIAIPQGQILLSVYDSETAHDGGGKPVAQAAVPVKDGQAVAVFDGLAPGRYAVKSFHDVNGDGQMNANPFGMPLEPFAFSNNAPPEGGPAKWARAAFDVAAGEATTAITIR